MAYQKAYSRINWENYPSVDTPINEANLNKIDAATDELDNRILNLDVTKLGMDVAYTMVQSIAYERDSGRIIVSYLNGAKAYIDTDMEKLAIDIDYDADTQRIIIISQDGTKKYADISSLITQYEFEDSDTIAHDASGGKVKSRIKDGSITEEMLRPNLMADVKQQVAITTQNANNAAKSESNAQLYMEQARAAENNAEQTAKESADLLAEAEKAVGGVLFTMNFATGELMYDTPYYNFNINADTGNLEWEVNT